MLVWISGSGPGVAEGLIFHAASAGQQTLDQGEGGGNPFASALIEALGRRSLALDELPGLLAAGTHTKSGGRQAADVPREARPADWPMVPATPGERRVAFVLVIADYSNVPGAKSLPGARRDAERVAAALEAAGFTTEIALDLTREGLGAKLGEIGARTRDTDAAVIYTTGHGVEVEGTVYLIPADYPLGERAAALARRALPLRAMAAALQARSVNLVFYGGCRDNPFAPAAR